MNNDNHIAASSSCCGTTTPSSSVSGIGRENLLTPAEAGMTSCPVMIGSPVSKSVAEAAGLYRDFGGQRFWFCCAGCGPAFDSDPAKYAANMA